MPVLGYVLVRTAPGTSAELVGSRRIRGVKMANSVFGRFDAVLVISAKNLDEFSKVVYEVVERHPNVVHTETLLAIPYPDPREPTVAPPGTASSIISFHCPSCHSLVERGSPFCSFCGLQFK